MSTILGLTPKGSSLDIKILFAVKIESMRERNKITFMIDSLVLNWGLREHPKSYLRNAQALKTKLAI